MHTFYVLAKIYRLTYNDPLLFQKEYTEAQLEQIFKGKPTDKNDNKEKK
jgi:hypothetical protein